MPVVDEQRGRVPKMYISLKPGIVAGKAVVDTVMREHRDHDRQGRPSETRADRSRHAEDPVGQDHAPRDRVGLELMDVGDVSTLANPEVVEQIRREVQREKAARGEVPRKRLAEEQKEIAADGHAE